MSSATFLIVSLALSFLAPHPATGLSVDSAARNGGLRLKRADGTESAAPKSPCHVSLPSANGPPPQLKSWQDLCEDEPVTYIPSGSTTKLVIAPLGKQPRDITNLNWIYNITVNGLADIVNASIAGSGNLTIKKLDHGIEKFERTYPPSKLIFSFSTSQAEQDVATLQTVADTLKGIQELTHIITLTDLIFGVFDLGYPKDQPLAEGCLGYHCWDDPANDFSAAKQKTMNTDHDLDHDIKKVSSSEADLTLGDLNDGINITISDSSRSKSIRDQNYADVATEMLWRMIPSVVKAGGDAPLPHDPNYNRPGWHLGDEIWHSSFSLNFWEPNDTESDFTLGRVAKTLAYVEQSFDKESLVESRMVVRVSSPPDTNWKVSGIGCMSYTPSSDAAYNAICQSDNPAVGTSSPTQPSSVAVNAASPTAVL